MSKLKKASNKKLILILPIILVVSFGVLLTYSFATFKSIKLFDAVGGFFLGNEYTLSYDVANCTNKTIKNGKTFGELCNPATPDGYNFVGWFYNNEEIISSTNVRVTDNIELEAHFVAACNMSIGDYVEYDYNGSNGSDGSIQSFVAACPGLYKLEVWGAQGGTANTNAGGKGGYASGNILLTNTENLFIAVGGKGGSGSGAVAGGYNGGGAGNYSNVGGGGGATSISYTENLLKNTSKQDLLIVAGGGGGSSYYNSGKYGYGGAGGGTNGIGSSGGGGGGSQTGGGGGASYDGNSGQGGSYGQGGNAGSNTNSLGAGGGGGYYGGGAGYHHRAGGGGSGYVSSSLLSTKNIAGNAAIPTYDGTSTMTGNSNHGHAKITYISSSEYEQVINYTMLYDGSLGNADDNKMTDITGGWNPNTGIRWGVCGRDAYNFTYSYNANNMYIASSKNSYYNHGGGLYTGNTINFDNYSGLFSFANPTRSSTGSFSMCYDNMATRFCYNGGAICNETSTVKTGVQSLYCDIASVTGNYTVGVGTGTCGDNVASASGYIYDIWLTKADNYSPLFDISGISGSTIDDLLTNSSTLLSDHNAVTYMIYNCTGDFMAKAISNSTFMTALESSPYKDEIYANTHWAKFLNILAN